MVLSFTEGETDSAATLVAIVGGALLLAAISRSPWFNRLLTPIIEWALSHTTDLQVKDYTRILGLQEEYRVAEVAVGEGDWLANVTPASIELGDEGVVLLGIQREDQYIGAPDADTEIRPGDVVVLYGKEDRLQELSERATGDQQAHRDAVDEHAETLREQARWLAE